MKHKSVSVLSSFLLLSSFIPTFSFPCKPTSKSNKIRQKVGSPIEGFTLETQFNTKIFDEKDGYCYMDAYIYSTKATSSDPHNSYQYGKDTAYQEWSFSVINQSIAGSSTYWFHALNLLEVKNDNIDSVPDNSFEMNYSVKMITTTNSITRNSQFQYC